MRGNGLKLHQGRFRLDIGKISLLKEWSDIGTGCPGQWGSPHPWRGSKNMWMWHFRTWFSRQGGVGVTVGLDDLRGLFQLSRFCDSTLYSVGSQGISWARWGCPSPLGQATLACLAPEWVLVLGTSCSSVWWPASRHGAGWPCADAGEGAAPSPRRLGPHSITPSSCRDIGRQDMGSVCFGRGRDKECQNTPRW